MTFSAVGSPISPTVTGKTFTLVPGTVGDFILFSVICTSTVADWATALTSAGGDVTWTAVGSHFAGSSGINDVTVAVFIGKVVTASSHTVTVTTNAGSPTLRVAGQEFSNTAGFSAVTLDASGTIDVASSGEFPPVTPLQGAGDLYWSFVYDNGSGVVGTTSGYSYHVDVNGNIQCYNLSCANALQQPNIGDPTNGTTGIAVMMYEAGGAVTSTGSVSMATMGATGTGAETITSTGSVSLASMAAQGTGSTSGFVTATGSVSMASMAASGTGQVPVIATGSVSLATMAASGTGQVPVIASGSASLAGVSAGGSGIVAPPVSGTGSVSLGTMAVAGSGGSGTVTVAGTWTGSYAVSSGFYFPYPSSRPLQIPIANTAGDWVFALVAWRPSTTGSGASVCVADDAHNWWEPVGAPSTDSGAAGAVRTAVWAAPAAKVANSVTGQTIVQVAATGPVLSLAATIVDMAGLLPWYQVAAISTGPGYANAATSLSASTAAPSARALLFAAFGSDSNGDTVTGPSGWTALTGASASNGVDTTADIRLTPAYQVTTGSATASVSSSGSLDLSGVIAGVLVSAAQPAQPAQPNPYWPVMITEAAIGSGVQTPPSEMTWTQLGGRSLALTITQGRQYSLGQLQAGQGTLTLDDPDGALIPPGTGSYAGIDSGTPLRRRVIWPGLPGSPNLTPNYVAFGGYFSRWPWNMDANMLRGQVQATTTDTWGYGNGTLNSMAVEEALLDNPHSLWPLTDPAGSTGAGNLVPNGAPLELTTSKYGDGGAAATWGANSGVLLGTTAAKVTSSGSSTSASGMFEQVLSGTSQTYGQYGYALTCTDTSFPPVSGGVTVECFAQLQLGAVQRGGTSTSSPHFGGTSSLPAGQAVVLEPVPGFTFPTGPTAGVQYIVLTTGTSYDLSTTPGGSPVAVTVNGSFYLYPTVAWNPVILAARGLTGTIAQLEVQHLTGALVLRYRPAGAVSDTQVTVDSANDYRNAASLLHFSLAFNETSWRVLVNGGGTATASGTFSSALPAVFTTACFGGVMDRANQGDAFTGYTAFAGIYPGISPQVRVLSRTGSANTGMSSEAACDRVERLLEYAGLTGRRWLGQQVIPYEGDLCVSGQDVGGQASVSSMNNIAASTAPAILYVAPTGDVMYRSKLYTWNEPVRWVLGDDTAGGEIPFTPGSIATDYDPSRVTADVQLTQLDTQTVTTPNGVMSATTMAAVAATAEGQYGGQPYQQTGYLEFDWSSPYDTGGSLQDLANWVQAVFARPQNRIQAVTVDAARHPAAWPFWGGASNGDMVQVNVRMPTAVMSPLISLTARITQTARSSQFSQDTAAATIACTLDFAPEYNALTCDDAVRGLLNGTNVMPW